MFTKDQALNHDVEPQTCGHTSLARGQRATPM
jgi:hypothetical protein